MAITLTPEELAALKAALVRPVERVQVGDMSVQYPALRDIWAILNSEAIVVEEPAVPGTVGQGGRTYALFSRE